MTYLDRMNKGLDLLDQKFPNWAFHIDTDTLDLDSTMTCVVSQLFPSEWFGEAVEAMCDEFDIDLSDYNDPYEFAVEYGFDDVRAAVEDHAVTATDMWLAAIAERV